MFKNIKDCADGELLLSKLTKKALQDIEHVLDAYEKGDIDFISPRDEYGNPDTGDYELVINNKNYKENGTELLVMKWVESHESTEYLLDYFTDTTIYPISAAV